MKYLSILLLTILVIVAVMWESSPASSRPGDFALETAGINPAAREEAVKSSPGPAIGSMETVDHASEASAIGSGSHPADCRKRVKEPRAPIRKAVAGVWRLLFASTR